MGLTIDHIDIVTHQYYHIWDTIDVDNTSVSCNKQFIWYVPTQPSNCQEGLSGVEPHPMDYADWTYSPSHPIDHCAWLSRKPLYVHLAVWHTSLFGCQMPNPKSFPSSKRGSKGVSAKDWELWTRGVWWYRWRVKMGVSVYDGTGSPFGERRRGAQSVKHERSDHP